MEVASISVSPPTRSDTNLFGPVLEFCVSTTKKGRKVDPYLMLLATMSKPFVFKQECSKLPFLYLMNSVVMSRRESLNHCRLVQPSVVTAWETLQATAFECCSEVLWSSTFGNTVHLLGLDAQILLGSMRIPAPYLGIINRNSRSS